MTLNSYLDNKISELEKTQENKESCPQEFWCNNYSNPDGSLCCFNHWVGLPTRWNKRHPIYKEQQEMIRETLKNKYIVIEKEPKRGITELYLRFSLHQALINKDWNGGQVCIVVGTNTGEAETMISRAKEIVKHKVNINEHYNTKKEFSVSNCLFKAIPADNIDAIRSKTNMKLILVDEAAFFRMIEQQKVRDAVEHYIGGSETFIIFVSTAGEAPEGVMFDILNEENSIYHKIITDYHDGLIPDEQSGTTIFSKEGIENAMKLRSWARNYLHSWHSGEGDIFTHEDVDAIMKEFDRFMPGGNRIIAIDPAYGSSKFGVVIGILLGGILYIVFAREYSRQTPTYMISEVERLYKEYHLDICLCDGHYSGEIRDLIDRQVNTQAFAFDTENKSNMINSASDRVISKTVQIHRTLHDLAGQMKASKTDKKGHLDKKRMSLDMLECFCMICERVKTSTIKIIKI